MGLCSQSFFQCFAARIQQRHFTHSLSLCNRMFIKIFHIIAGYAATEAYYTAPLHVLYQLTIGEGYLLRMHTGTRFHIGCLTVCRFFSNGSYCSGLIFYLHNPCIDPLCIKKFFYQNARTAAQDRESSIVYAQVIQNSRNIMPLTPWNTDGRIDSYDSFLIKFSHK